jgi:branched-chain amino acid transport system substrate-binding protein
MFRSALTAFLALLISGAAQASNAGITPTEIRLGASAVLSGPLGPQTAEYGVGSRLLFDAVNEAGGIHGRKISYVTLDDAFDTQRAVENTRKLVDENKVFMIYNSTGTAHTAAVLPMLKESRTILFGPVTGASSFRDNFNPLVFHVRASYANEARRIISQMKLTGITRVAAFYQDDGFGKALLSEVQKAAQAENLPLTIEVNVNPAQPDFTAAAQAIAQARPQAVILCTAGGTFTNLIKAMQQTASKPSFYGFSVASLDVINKELQDKARGVILAQIMPSLRSTNVSVVREYLELLQKKSPEAVPSASQFEGFVHARLLVEGLRRTGRDLNTDSFIRTMEGAGDIAFGPFRARYSPESHNGSAYVELAIVGPDGQLRY